MAQRTAGFKALADYSDQQQFLGAGRLDPHSPALSECLMTAEMRRPDANCSSRGRKGAWLVGLPRVLERALIIGEIRRTEYENARLMIAVKRSTDGRAARVGRVVCISKPHGYMAHLDRRVGIGESEGLVTEDANEVPNAATPSVSSDLPLVPAETEWPGRVLRDEQREIVVGRESDHFDVHMLDRSQIADSDASMCVAGEASGACSRHHFEAEAVVCFGARHHTAQNCCSSHSQGE